MFHHFKKISITNCTSLVEVFELEAILDLDAKKNDYELEEMELKNIPNLRHIWKCSISEVVSFTNLRKLSISECHKLTSVLPLSLAQNLSNLNICQCESAI